MTVFRLISLPTHAALEMLGGMAVMAAPFVLGFGPAGLVSAVVLGALITGLALTAATSEGATLPISAHFAFDRGMALGLLGGALVLALAGDRVAAAFFAAAAVAQLALTLITRYSAR